MGDTDATECAGRIGRDVRRDRLSDRTAVRHMADQPGAYPLRLEVHRPRPARLSQIYNAAPTATRVTCDKYTT